jgi:hypothetical protein
LDLNGVYSPSKWEIVGFQRTRNLTVEKILIASRRSFLDASGSSTYRLGAA